jgi:hypothetical protein
MLLWVERHKGDRMGLRVGPSRAWSGGQAGPYRRSCLFKGGSNSGSSLETSDQPSPEKSTPTQESHAPVTLPGLEESQSTQTAYTDGLHEPTQ